jgi:thymidine kinase
MVRVDGEKGIAFTPKNDKVHRLVNGITSPRFYRLKRNTINFDTEISDLEYSHYKQENCSMVALDFIYFFHNIENACDILLESYLILMGIQKMNLKIGLLISHQENLILILINLLYEDF